jgi:hypothetical protein
MDRKPKVGVASRPVKEMPEEHSDIPVWNAEDWYYEDFEVGHTIRSLRRTISEGEVMLFNSLVMDLHPYVADDTFAKKEGHFGKRLVAGALLRAFDDSALQRQSQRKKGRKRVSKVKLHGMTWDHNRGYDPMVATANKFTQLHPNVEIIWHKRSLQAFADRPLEEMTSEFDLLWYYRTMCKPTGAGFARTVFVRCYLAER